MTRFVEISKLRIRSFELFEVIGSICRKGKQQSPEVNNSDVLDRRQLFHLRYD